MITITEQDFYNMRNQRDEARREGIEKDIRIAALEATVNKLAALLKEGGEIVSEYKQRETKLIAALEMVFEVHPTRNTKENYVEAVRAIAAAVLAEVMK